MCSVVYVCVVSILIKKLLYLLKKTSKFCLTAATRLYS